MTTRPYRLLHKHTRSMATFFWKSCLAVPFLCLVFVSAQAPVQAAVQITVTPSIATSMEYDDNIFLEENDTESDMLFIVSPGIGIDIRSPRTAGSISYTPSKVFYQENSQLDNWRHYANLSFLHDFSQFLSFRLQDTYLQTDDPLAEDIRDLTEEEIKDRARQGRNEYWRNNLSGAFAYQFGPGNRISAGYTYNILQEKSDAEDDAREQGPFVNVKYRLDEKNAFTADFNTKQYDYEREDGQAARDDIQAHNMNISYIRNITEQTSTNVGYGVGTRNYDGETPDYVVHDLSTGLSHTFSQNFSASLGVGYFYQDEEGGGDSEGYSFRGSVRRRFEFCSIGLSAEHGWDEDFLDRTPEGFTRFWRFSANWRCTPTEHLEVFANFSYRIEDEDNGSDEDIITAQCGISRSFFRWYALSLRYLYQQNKSDLTEEEYTDNRVTLTLSFSRPYTWMY